MNPITLAIVMVLTAHLVLVVTDTTTKWLVLATVPALQVAFARYSFHLLITVTEVGFRGIKYTQIRENFWLLLLRGIALASSTGAIFYSLKYIPLSVYSVLLFTAPFFICMLSWPMLAERVGAKRWLGICMGFVGVIIIVRPFGETFHWAALLTVYAAFAFGLYNILTRKLAKQVQPHVMQFSVGVIGVLSLLPFAWWVWQPLTSFTIGLMAVVGLSAWLGHELLARAHKSAPASVLSLYTYSFILYATLAGFLLFDEIPDALTIVGALVIVVAGLIVWRHDQRLGQSL